MIAQESRGSKAAGARPAMVMIDLFAGVGGLTLGFLDAGNEPGWRFQSRLMVDVDREAREVALRNFAGVPYLVADIHKLSGAEVRTRAGLGPTDTIHVLVGGPPCQGFSWLGRRILEDDRNIHLVDFLRMVKELRPLSAVMENVPLIITSHGGAVVTEIMDGFRELGYSSLADTLFASDFGVPQLRKRAFIIAYRSDLGVPPQLPNRTHERVDVASDTNTADRRVQLENDKIPYVSVEDAIGDLPPLAAGEGAEYMPYSAPPSSGYQRWARRGSVGVFNHKSRAHSAGYLEKISVIGEGQRNMELPDGERFSDNYYSQAYARLHRNGIGQTVTTCFGNPGSGRFMHYRDLRSITVREAARLQSFPDTFVFDGFYSTQMRHVGNAVPPLLARAVRDQVGRDLAAALEEEERHRPSTRGWRETPQLRSRIMRAVQGKDTSAEMALRSALRAKGLRGYRLHDSRVPGSPDVIFGGSRVAVFVDGCFWHGCEKCYREPNTRKEYWKMKVSRNRDRDARVTAECKGAGWRVLRIWEHDVLRSPTKAVARISRALRQTAKQSLTFTGRPRAGRDPERPVPAQRGWKPTQNGRTGRRGRATT